MALLDEIFLRSLPASPGFAPLDPKMDEPAMAQEAREAAAERMRRAARRPQAWGPFDPVVAPGIGLLSELGGGQMAPEGADAAAMPGENVPLPQPRPQVAPSAPTDLSAVARSAGPAVPTVQQAAMAASPEPSGWDRFWGRVPEASTLLAMAGGFSGAPSIGDGMRRAFSAAAPMAAINERQQQARQTQNQTVRYLMARGMSESDARAAASNPALLTSLLKKPDIPAGYRVTAAGNLEFIPGGPADPAVKRAQADRQNAPSGYEWVDPSDTSKGLRALPGGPAGKLPSEVAGRLALMHEAAAGIPQARDILLKGRGDTGTGVSGAAASYTNIGDTGRAQRTIRTAIEGVLRAMTGAAAPHSEVERYESMFMPSPFDSPATAKQKMDQLQGFIDRATKLITMGHGGPELMAQAMGGSAPAATGPLGVNQSRVINGVTIKRLN